MESKELRDIIAIALRQITVISKVTVDEEFDCQNSSSIFVTHNDKTLEVTVLDPEL